MHIPEKRDALSVEILAATSSDGCRKAAAAYWVKKTGRNHNVMGCGLFLYSEKETDMKDWKAVRLSFDSTDCHTLDKIFLKEWIKKNDWQ